MEPTKRKRPNPLFGHLMARGLRAPDIAERVGLDVTYVQKVIRGVRRQPKIEAAIAEALERPVEELFPPADEAAA